MIKQNENMHWITIAVFDNWPELQMYSDLNDNKSVLDTNKNNVSGELTLR